MTVKFTPDTKNNRVLRRIENLDKMTKQGIRQGMFKVAQSWRAEANREILKGRKTGIVYIHRTRSGSIRRHRSSAAGETHANASGVLRKSTSFQLKGTSEIEVGYGVSSGNTAPVHARFIDGGTKHMKARPGIMNALDAEQGNTVRYFEQHIDRAIR